ncbi:MAG: hypothetical protein Q4C10_01140 [Clostridia bacterium]|nr:hypothetical protein [Clostridia bacterium]
MFFEPSFLLPWCSAFPRPASRGAQLGKRIHETPLTPSPDLPARRRRTAFKVAAYNKKEFRNPCGSYVSRRKRVPSKTNATTDAMSFSQFWLAKDAGRLAGSQGFCKTKMAEIQPSGGDESFQRYPKTASAPDLVFDPTLACWKVRS